ncbi:MAG: neutral/alkaline non-lysosomal ceramidase N-terminal domain-containing protein [Blastocatellia bacterium]|nr:neutral/alkaline non-lysosomal ceramidase N-terminal domain-containing protein [Blastocatellia bacterium]
MRQITLLLILLLVAAIAAEAQSVFRAGAARVDITPAPGFELWGYSNRTGPATATLDPLYARVLVLDDGSRSTAVITLDLGRSFGRAQIARLREQARRAHRVDEVMLIASHTHSGPVIEDTYEGRLPEWEERALDRIVAAIGEARSAMVPARIGVGMGQATIGHNRRVVQSDGSVRMLWRNSTGRQTGMIDPTVGVIRVDDLQDNPLAILVNYACHPVVFGPDNLRYSADYPGAMAKLVEAGLSGPSTKPPICFFLQGAPGDINPLLDKTPLAENADALKIAVGEELGREALRVARQIRPEAPATPEVAFLSEELRFRNRWDLDVLQSMIARVYGAERAKRYQQYVTPEIVTPVTTLVINKQIALVGLPGEPFVGLQLLLKQRSPLATTFMCGYTNGYFGYFPTLDAAVSGGYGANTIVTRVEIGAGERMVNRGLIHIYRILGRLKDKPEQP